MFKHAFASAIALTSLGCSKQEVLEAPLTAPSVQPTSTGGASDILLKVPTTPSSSASSTAHGRTPAKQGAMCAGIMGIPCAAGLRCVVIGKGADMSGTCQPQ